jgi:toxin ParE1/3/4
MPKRIRIDAEAREEIERGIDWYEEKRKGLGQDFLTEVRTAIADLASPGPECVSPVGVPNDLGVRRKFVRRFPYLVLFIEFERTVRVIAVPHAHQRPGYWRKRR